MIVWVLNTYVLPTELPDLIEGAIELIVVSGITFGAGFLARHTHRDDPDAFVSSGRHASLDE